MIISESNFEIFRIIIQNISKLFPEIKIWNNEEVKNSFCMQKEKNILSLRHNYGPHRYLRKTVK